MIPESPAIPNERPITTAEILFRFVVYFSSLSACLFVTAGTLRWPEAWVLLSILLVFTVYMAAWLKKYDPALLRERMTYFKKGSKRWDRIIVRGFGAISIPLYALPGLDAVRFHWSRVPFPVQCVAFFGIAAAMSIFVAVARTNTFLTPVVEIQHRRGHRVVSSGPYARVRHPMYVGVLLQLFCLPLFLGSCWTLIVSVAGALLLLVRTSIEDKTLLCELDGYAEYAQRVRYRIVPGVW